MNVLIVDDQPSARTMLRHVVEAIGPGIHTADFGSPAEALRWAEANPTDLVLLDYRMPEMDGLEFARRFRRSLSRRDVPIVLISVVGDEPVRQAALEAGVIDFLVKPVRPRELRSRCKNLLQMRKQGESVKERARSLEARVLEGIQEVEQREREMLYLLAKAIEYRRAGTAVHLMRVARYVELIAEQVGMADDDVKTLVSAAPLYDIGKIGIPDAVLAKRADLTESERVAMRKHPQIGFEILRDSSSRFVQMGALIALRHHERWNGSGYPNGLAGEDIPLPARIVGIADVFDALTTERNHQQPWSADAAFDYLLGKRGTLFDPACVDVFLIQKPRIVEILGTELDRPRSGSH